LFTIFLKIPFQRDLTLGSELRFGFSRGASSAIVTLLILLGFGATLFVGKKKRFTKDLPLTVLFGLLVLGLCAAQLLWLRTVDFLWPMLIAAIAYLHGRHPTVFRDAKRFLLPKFFAGSFLADLFIVLAILQSITIGVIQISRDERRSLTPFRAIEAVAPGATVLNAAWDSFPPFLALRSDLRYATGMDPTFLHDEDPVAYALIAQFEHVGTESLPAGTWTEQLLDAVPSDVLVVRNQHPKPIDALKRVPRLQLVTSTGSFAVFRVRW
ncbi:hypothetical protein HYZ99_01805, partial [Candidatus Peregrinibacteria bacterium]|nr:hypothetical protein [Candidatus Peregrinibacteria bacterium]